MTSTVRRIPLKLFLLLLPLLAFAWMVAPTLVAPLPSQASVAHAEPLAPNACPAAPATLSNLIERTNFCVYYNQSATSDYANGTLSLADATFAADQIQAYWDRYTTDFGFLPPAFTSKLEVRLDNTMSGCNGQTSSSWNHLETTLLCYNTFPESIQKVLGHELFHRVQYSYDGGEVKWFKEGTARAMEDQTFNNIDNWAGTLSAVSSSFNKQVNTYLASTNQDITSEPMRYNSALWWKYFAEQYGSTVGEPQFGVDAFVALWQAAATADDVAAVNSALSSLGAGVTFDTAFRRFAVAAWTKDLTGLPDASYNFADEDQAGNGAPYGPLVPASGGTISSSTSAVWSNQAIARYGVAYYQATPGANCDVISATFHRDSGTDLFYHVVTQKGSAFAQHVEGSGADWSQSFLNDGITKIVAIVGGQANSGQADVTLSCADPVVDIRIPNSVAVAHVGPHDGAGKFLAQVLVTNGSPNGPVVGGLTKNDFKAKVNGVNALVTAGGFVQEQYWLVIQAPDTGANGTYDLEISLEASATSTVIATDTNAASIVYDPDNADQVLVIDRSGSMSLDGKMAAAKNAANFYIDVMRNNDGLAVVPYNENVNPAPFPMQLVNLTVRDDAKDFVNGLSASGSTSIGDGMDEAVDQINSSPTSNTRCAYVLLSDGMENSPLYWADVAAGVVATGCPVSTIAFGPESNETLMQNIASATGGLFFYNDVYVSSREGGLSPEEMELQLGDTYEYSQEEAEGRQRLLSESGEIPYPPVEQVHTVMVDPTVSEVLFALDWVGRSIEMEMRLRTPSGDIIDSSTRPYDFQDFRSGHLGWRIEAPEAGEWQILVTHQGGAEGNVPYHVVASARSYLTLHLLLPDRLGLRYFTGNRLPIFALLSSDRPLPNLMLHAIVTAPDGTETMVQLFDDGQHGDGGAGDGLYGGSYLRVNQAIEVAPSGEEPPPNEEPNDEAGYRVRLLAQGGDVMREALGSFSVLEGADDNGNGLPDPFEDEYGVTNAAGDPDLDELNTADEYFAGTSPTNSDTDGSGENDGSEVLYHGLDPLDPSDDQIEAPEFFNAAPATGEVTLTYDVKGEYEVMLLYRATSPDGPWTLRNAELPLTGLYEDPATNGQTYFYRLMALDAQDHRSAVLDSEAVTPSEDPLPPEARVLVDGGAPSTFDLNVVLSFEPYEESQETFEDITEMLISNDPDFEGASWQPFAQDVPWTLAPTAPGEIAHVYVRFRDDAGNESVSTEVGSIQVSGLSPWAIHLPIVTK